MDETTIPTSQEKADTVEQTTAKPKRTRKPRAKKAQKEFSNSTIVSLDPSVMDGWNPEFAQDMKNPRVKNTTIQFEGRPNYMAELLVDYDGPLTGEPFTVSLKKEYFDTEQKRQNFIENGIKNIKSHDLWFSDHIVQQRPRPGIDADQVSEIEARMLLPLRDEHLEFTENDAIRPSPQELARKIPRTYVDELQKIRQQLTQEQQVEPTPEPDQQPEPSRAIAVVAEPELAKTEEIDPGLPAIQSPEVTIPEPEIVDSGIGQEVVTAKAQVNYGPEDDKKRNPAVNVDFEPMDTTEQPEPRTPAKEPEQQVEPTDPAPTEPTKEKEPAMEPEQAPVTEPEPTQPEQTKPAPTKAPDQQAQEMLNNWPSGVAVPNQEQRHLFEPKIPPEVLHCKNGNPKKPYVLDHGDRIAVTNRAMLGIGREAQNKREQSVAIALDAAVKRFGEPVQFHGTRAFEKETIDVAVRYGIALEPVSEHAKSYYKEALARQQKQQLAVTNSLGPARKKEQSKDQGIGL